MGSTGKSRGVHFFFWGLDGVFWEGSAVGGGGGFGISIDGAEGGAEDFLVKRFFKNNRNRFNRFFLFAC